MALNAIESWAGRRLRPSATGWTAERLWTVAGAASAMEALTAAGLPTINSPHPQNSLMKCSDLDASTPEGPGLWEVRATYSIAPGGGDHTDTNNVDATPRLRWGLTITSEEVDRDVDGNAITNSAREPIEPHPQREIYEWTLDYTRNEPFFNLPTATQFQNKINSVEVTILGLTFEIGTIKVAKILPAEEYTLNASFVKMVYSLSFRTYPDVLPVQFFKSVDTSPHQLWRVDQGYNGWWKDGTTLKRARYVDGDNKAVNTPVLLAGNGTPVNTSFVLGEDTQHSPSNMNTPPGASVFKQDFGGTVSNYLLIWKNCRGKDINDLRL
jgi:hypothetical protein